MQFITPHSPYMTRMNEPGFLCNKDKPTSFQKKTYVEREDKKTKQIPADSTECFFVCSIDVLLREQPLLPQKHACGHDPLR
jgi:hypothetical protein